MGDEKRSEFNLRKSGKIQANFPSRLTASQRIVTKNFCATVAPAHHKITRAKVLNAQWARNDAVTAQNAA